MTKKIYLVCGSKGEHEDFSEWRVAAYAQRELAEKHCNLAQEDFLRVRQEANACANIRERSAIKNRFDEENCGGWIRDQVEYWVEDVFWCDENEYEHV